MPIFLVWMYLSWTVVLLGAVVTSALGDWRRAGGMPGAGTMTAETRLHAAIAVLAALRDVARTGGVLSRDRLIRACGSGKRPSISRSRWSMRSLMRRRSVSSFVSPGPLLPMPPPKRERLVP